MARPAARGAHKPSRGWPYTSWAHTCLKLLPLPIDLPMVCLHVVPKIKCTQDAKDGPGCSAPSRKSSCSCCALAHFTPRASAAWPQSLRGGGPRCGQTRSGGVRATFAPRASAATAWTEARSVGQRQLVPWQTAAGEPGSKQLCVRFLCE